MNETVKHLRQIIGGTALKHVSFQGDESLSDLFLREGSAALRERMEQAESWEEVEEVERIPLAVAQQPEKEPESKKETAAPAPDTTEARIEVIHESKLRLCCQQNHYYVLGQLMQDLSSLRITLMVDEIASGRKERTKIDLYERDTVYNFSLQLAEMFSQDPEQIEADLLLLTDLLEQHREQQMQLARPDYESKRRSAALSPENQRKCLDFLSKPKLIERIDRLIEQAGVVGEHNTRKLLFVISSTYKMGFPLHTLVQGTSGSGKSHLINTIGQCFPPEDVLSMTRVTSKSFYHYTKDELVDKLILIQDYDGLDEEAQYAFRELQSAGTVSSSTTYKDRYGNLMSAVKTVKSHFASLLATTKAEVYYDNMSRSVIIGVDETEEQTTKIIQHQNRRLAGLVDIKKEQQAKAFLQNCMRCIKYYEVVNRYADKVYLPMEAKMLRRLNSHYQAFVKQITILHQHQREKDEQGRLIAQPEDLKIACDILFDAIMLKVDDLDSSLRQFFDNMKDYIKKQANGKPEFQFTQRDVRLALNVSKTQCFRYMEDLELLEYIQRTGGYANRGFKYKIVFWDDMEKIRAKVKEGLAQQLTQLEDAA